MKNIEIEERYTIKKMRNLDLIDFINKYISEENLLRIKNCGSYLEFIADKTLENKKLNKANFCGNRFCPFCNWRKTRKDTLKHSILMEHLKKTYNYEFIFLTLTSPNVRNEELENEIKEFNESFKRLTKRKEFEKINKGYIRKLEVTYDNNEHITKELYSKKKNYYKSKGLKLGDKNPTYNTYNPHFHIIIAVNKSYFTDKTYLSKDKFLELWKECKRDSTITQIDIRKVDTNAKKAILELSKYTTKDMDYLANKDVFNVFYNALKGKQLITYNKAFKEALTLFKNGKLNYLKELDNTYYEFLLSYTFNFTNLKYDLFNLKELNDKEKLKYNDKLLDEFEEK